MKPTAPDTKAKGAQHFDSALSGLRSNKAKPRLVEPTSFVDGARDHSLPESVDGLDPNAPTTRGMNVRFNEFELRLIRELAEIEDRSMHKTVRRYLIPALRAAREGK